MTLPTSNEGRLININGIAGQKHGLTSSHCYAEAAPYMQ
jgi:hypothetical protein